MRNLKIAVKLLISFGIVIIMSIGIGVVGIVGMQAITKADTQLYVVQTKPLPDIAKALEYMQRLRVQMRNAIIFTGDAEELKTIDSDVSDRIKNFEGYLDAYDLTIVNPDARIAFDEARSVYNTQYKPGLLEIVEGAKAGKDIHELSDKMSTLTAASDVIVEDLTTCMNIKVQAASDASDANDALAMRMLILIVAVLAVAVLVAFSFTYYVSRIINRPIIFMREMLSQIGTKGILKFSDEEQRKMQKFAGYKDEVGESMAMLLTTSQRLAKVGSALEIVASGDLTTDLDLLSDQDMMGISLDTMIKSLNTMFGEIHQSAAQLSAGSKQIADGAQALAQGSTEQASAVQELSASINEIAEKATSNANLADEAAELSSTIKIGAETGSAQMSNMMTAVKEINDASSQIGKVIKVIDDIAFQTNILALNAAVEAARAGEAGKGFAVVAEEVRNLAGKSAEAAKDTSGLIENSIAKANYGLEIATETSASLNEIVSGINQSADIIDRIAQSAREEATAVTQINTGIDQVAQVVQQNSATAEESAAASEEMSGQASMLDTLIAQFKLKE